MQRNKRIPCPAPAELEQCATREAALPDTLALHLKDCPECHARFKEMQREAIAIQEALSRCGAPGSNCPERETAGCYLDGALDEGARTAYEGHLAQCTNCRIALVQLYRETRHVIAEASGGVTCEVAVSLVNAKSSKAVVNADSDQAPVICQEADEPNAPRGEQRKKRYMSESS